jgi:protease I
MKNTIATSKLKHNPIQNFQHYLAAAGILAFLGLLLFGPRPAGAAEINREGPVASGGMNGIYVPVPVDQSTGLTALILTDSGFNDMETMYPLYRFTEEGIAVTVVTPAGGNVQGYGGHIILDTKALADVDPAAFDILYLPGGKAPQALRENPAVIEAVQKFAATGKPVAAICHGPQILVTAGLVEGKNIACFSGVGDEVKAAGGAFVDVPVSVDGQFITSRLPKDLPRQMQAILGKLPSRE